MNAEHRFATIDSQTVVQLNKEYPSVVAPNLSELDLSRYDTTPSAVASRKASAHAFLTKQELTALVDWKLSHGTFRPTLKALVNQNSEETVEDTTRDAFATFDASSLESVKKSLTILTKLKGIGPATASLALSVYEPASAPFFSDELFRWISWEAGKGKGWDRQIKYTPKEYMDMFEKIQDAMRRINALKAVELEKAAYVLGKGAGKERTNQDASKLSSSKSDTAKPQGKRKRSEEKIEIESKPASEDKKPKQDKAPATRSSQRLKKS